MYGEQTVKQLLKNLLIDYTENMAHLHTLKLITTINIVKELEKLEQTVLVLFIHYLKQITLLEDTTISVLKKEVSQIFQKIQLA